MDFSENYACQLHTEVQAFHFGGGRKKATIHTSVVYTPQECQSYASISESLRHDERAVWAHLKPVLDDIGREKNIPNHTKCMSDGPVTQYRNKNNFYLLSMVSFLMGFKEDSIF